MLDPRMKVFLLEGRKLPLKCKLSLPVLVIRPPPPPLVPRNILPGLEAMSSPECPKEDKLEAVEEERMLRFAVGSASSWSFVFLLKRWKRFDKLKPLAKFPLPLEEGKGEPILALLLFRFKMP